ncbi:PREDICTED: growth-regulating factor 1-like [Tarenaya hassleriana]|uniref:growth-regulating factor 1-like n=1 Tax=Tarenaya hassleriana TaxID=28532 RepID=UPI00053C89FA|nr:PREDICTED: growth-regulating factor 1-like [Tarenaya hassleriana]
MDFGLVDLDSLVGSSSSSSGFGSTVSDPLTKQKLYGSGLFRKQERPVNDEHHDHGDDKDDGSLKGCKRMAKAVGDGLSGSDNGKSMSLLRSNCSPLFSAAAAAAAAAPQHHPEDQMLSFSSPKSNAQNANLLSYFQLSTVSPYSTRNAGCNNGFTQSQWIELEHQTLIYKYMCANIPIPSALLLPIRKAFESAGLSCLSGGLLRSNALGWGGFHLGFSSNADPEPGRCRRTDGKKWRCSKDAVPDQKYCERHMNRGRHRSRKPVEGQVQGHSSSAAMAKASAAGGATCASGIASKNTTTFALSQNQPKHSSMSDSINGVFMGKNTTSGEKHQEMSSMPMLSSRNASLRPEDSNFLFKHQNPFEKSSYNEFGFVPSESLLNPSPHGGSSRSVYLSDQATEAPSHHQLLQFMDNCPQNPSLAGSSDFLSRNRGKTATTTLRLSYESDTVPMGLGVQGGSSSNIPLSWDSSIGGPLGEALHNSSQSSPTGVLQKTTFVSMSNSSTGSSPRADSGRVYEGSSFCTDMLGPVPSLVHCSWSVPP